MSDHEGSDPATWNQASYTPDMGALDSLADVVADVAKNGIAALVAWHQVEIAKSENHARADAFRMVAAALWGPGNPRIRLAALAYVGGLDCTLGRSEQEWANEIGCTRAALNKEKQKWLDRLTPMNLPQPPNCKSQAARDTYSRRQRQVSKTRNSKSSSTMPMPAA